MFLHFWHGERNLAARTTFNLMFLSFTKIIIYFMQIGKKRKHFKK